MLVLFRVCNFGKLHMQPLYYAMCMQDESGPVWINNLIKRLYGIDTYHISVYV